jgi:type VI secretion system secreted protein Hcp
VNISKKTITILLSMVVLIFSGVGVYAAAQQNSGSKILYACIKENGQIRLVDESTKCNPNEEKINWNVEGPQGPIGAQGPAGKDGADGKNGLDGKDGAVGPQGPPGVSVPAGDGTPVLNYDVYMSLDEIQGESTTENYENWIELTGVEFGGSQTIGSGTGGAGNTGKTTLNDFVVKKSYDSSSKPLFQSLLNGRHIEKGKIVFVTRGESPTPILTIELTEVMVADYNFDNAFETIALNFAKIETTYTE